MTWYIITGRISNDDEDSCLMFETDTSAEAVDKFREYMGQVRREVYDDDEISDEALDDQLPIYVNYVISCPAQPTIEEGPYG